MVAELTKILCIRKWKSSSSLFAARIPVAEILGCIDLGSGFQGLGFRVCGVSEGSGSEFMIVLRGSALKIYGERSQKEISPSKKSGAGQTEISWPCTRRSNMSDQNPSVL